ncbi:hypothetical protein BC941DRAFT_414829 [Chlamydoabsidia padenii]|nr:hypothetical protein BC941DRAFT_414829 [Chlamydoabsidia padenii]
MPERVYIGNLHRDTLRSDLRDMFEPFGRILDLTVKVGFGFVEFESTAAAEDAVHKCNDTKLHGQRIVVEIALKRRDRSDAPARREREQESYRLIVKNLPPKTTWQDLKDMMKKAGRVTFADILKDCDEGIVEFAHRDDMLYALRKYDDTKLNGQRVTLEEAGRRRRRSSRDRSVSRSRSRSPRRNKSRRSRSRSVSSHGRSRSRSVSPRRSRSRSVDSSTSVRSTNSRSPLAEDTNQEQDA